jgi:hypothetical protein
MMRLLVLFLAGIWGCAAGCTKPELTVEVRGKVTLDDKPLAEGEIYFVTAGLPPEILPIKDGAFAGKAKPGSRRVEIHAYRLGEVSPTATIAPEPSKENYIPARFNASSTLQAEIRESGPNELEFSIQSH